MARQNTQPEQHCLSGADFGACWPQSFAGASIFIFAQQLAFAGCGTAPRAGSMVAAIDAEIARQSRSRNVARIRRQITASTIPSQSQNSAGAIRCFACIGLLQLAISGRYFSAARQDVMSHLINKRESSRGWRSAPRDLALEVDACLERVCRNLQRRGPSPSARFGMTTLFMRHGCMASCLHGSGIESSP